MGEDLKHRNTMFLKSLAGQGADSRAFDSLFTAAQQELSAMAAYLMNSERANHTLQPTALVNEAYLHLFEVEKLDGKAGPTSSTSRPGP